MSQKLWQKCLNKLRYNLSKYEFNMWILPLQAVIYDKYINLYAPNLVVLNYVRKNYLIYINQFIFLFYKNVLKINFYVGSVNENSNKFSKKNNFFLNNLSNKFNDCYLIKKYKFDNFIVSKSNLVAYRESINLSYLNTNSIKLLSIYSKPGLGKTHLLNAIGNNIGLLYGFSKNIIYINSKIFVSKMVWSLYNNCIEEFRSYFKNAYILLFDDIQFLENKTRSQEEFFCIIDYLIENNCFIVLTSNDYIENINLNNRLISRLLFGMVIKLSTIDYKIRYLYLKNNTKFINLKLSDNIIEYISNLNINNILKLQGVLNNLLVYSIYNKRLNNITIDFVIYILYNFCFLCNDKNRILNIQNIVSDYYKISILDLLSKSRNKYLIYPRHMSIAISRKLTNFSLLKLGNFFGGLNHSTILYSCKKIKKLSVKNRKVKLDFNNLIKLIVLSKDEILYKKRKSI